MSDYTTFLFTTPSAVQGAASVVDLAGQLPVYNTSRSEDAADLRALRADTAAVLNDARSVLRRLATR